MLRANVEHGMGLEVGGVHEKGKYCGGTRKIVVGLVMPLFLFRISKSMDHLCYKVYDKHGR